MFIILSGSSGAGKNTVINELFKNDKRLKKFVTYTTRQKRDGEVNHINYHFVTKEEFEEKQKNGEFLEVESIHGNMYGSSMIDLISAIQQGHILINDFGVEGVKNLKDKLKGKVDIVTIYLNVPKDILRQRLIERGDKADNIDVRMQRYEYENEFSKDYDYVIDNINLDETVRRIQGIINERLCERCQ
ncbi:MAG: guanylate kinase [Christensenellales bacterium]